MARPRVQVRRGLCEACRLDIPETDTRLRRVFCEQAERWVVVCSACESYYRLNGTFEGKDDRKRIRALEKAIRLISEEDLTLREAEERTGVPRSTIHLAIQRGGPPRRRYVRRVPRRRRS